MRLCNQGCIVQLPTMSLISILYVTITNYKISNVMYKIGRSVQERIHVYNSYYMSHKCINYFSLVTCCSWLACSDVCNCLWQSCVEIKDYVLTECYDTELTLMPCLGGYKANQGQDSYKLHRCLQYLCIHKVHVMPDIWQYSTLNMVMWSNLTEYRISSNRRHPRIVAALE